MYKKIFSFILFVCIAHGFDSQAQGKGEKIESIKIAFLSEKLDLDPKTAEKFWPIYNQYDDEIRSVILESKRADENRSIEEILDQEQKAIDIKRKYSALFAKVISNEQITQLYKSEKEFHKMLIRRMQMRKNMQNMTDPAREERKQNRRQMNQDNNSEQPQNSRPPMMRRGGR